MKNLYLPPDASEARRAAQAAYVAALDEVAAKGPRAHLLAACDVAHRAYGAVLLAEDKARRPHVYRVG